MFVFEPLENKIKKLPDLFLSGKGQKQPAEAVFWKHAAFCRRTIMSKSDFNKVEIWSN